MPSASISVDELAELIVAAGEHHHAAFQSSDGVDPEWALWYAGYLQAHLWDRGGTLPSRSLLTYLLIAAEAQYAEGEIDEPWSVYYATLILQRLTQPESPGDR